MADYNIYIHTIGSTGNANPTTPWSKSGNTSPTNPWDNEESEESSGSGSIVKSLAKGISFLNNPDSILGAGISTIAKAIPYVAVAAMVVKTGVKIYEGVSNYEALMGDYRRKTQYENARNILNNITHPFQSSVTAVKTAFLTQLDNDRRTMQRELLGDSIINSYTNRGV